MRCWLLTHQVLFPLLTKLLENISPADVGGMEETRMRASTLLSKVLLTTLHPATLSTPASLQAGKPRLLVGPRFVMLVLRTPSYGDSGVWEDLGIQRSL